MCSVSAVGDYWQRNPGIAAPYITPMYASNYATKAELDVLRKEMEALRELLVAAKKYDEATGQPHCESEEKVALIKRLAEIAGVDMQEVFR